MSGEDNEQESAAPEFNRTGEYVKHIGKSTFRGALKGALIAAGVGAGIAMIGGGAALMSIGALVTPIPVIGWIAGPVLMGIGAFAGATTGLALALKVALPLATLGAKMGGIIGLGTGVLNAGEAVEQAEADRAQQAERLEMKLERAEALGMRRHQQQVAMLQQGEAMGVSPGVPMGKGKGQGQGMW